MKETFQIYLNSRDAITGSGNPNICHFDLSAIIPNVNSDRCRVRVSYFDVAVNSAAWTTGDVSTILVTCPGHMAPNSYESMPSELEALGRRYIRNSAIIGAFSTGNTANVSRMEGANLQYVPIGNIFDGGLTIELVDQRRRSLVGDLNSENKSWSLMLDIEIEPEASRAIACGCHYFFVKKFKSYTMVKWKT